MAGTRGAKRGAAGPWRLRLARSPCIVSPAGVEYVLERRAAALFALVVLEPGIERRKVAGLLWPHSEAARARQALRQQLLRLKTLAGRDLVGGDPGLRLSDEVATDLEEAGDGLLGDFIYEDEEALASWVEAQRRARRDSGAARLAANAASAEASGDFAAALAHAEALLHAAGDEEEHHRRVMRLHYLAGDVARARRAYQRLCEMLEREFGARPSAQTEQLARTLAAAGAGPARAVPPSVLRPPRLVGREREWQALESAWDGSTLAFVEGVAGMGKSRLLADFAASRGDVAVVAARPGDDLAAYSLVARLARTLLQRVRSPLPDGVRAELARVLPELGEAQPVRDAADAARLRRAIEALVDAAVASGLRGLAVDDLHYADGASLEAIEATVLGDTQLGRLLAGRGDEIGAAARAMVERQVASARAIRVALSPLDGPGVEALLASLDVPGLDARALARPIARHTGGNPLFVLETVKAMALQAEPARGGLPVAQGVGALIERRLAHLSAEAVKLARCAAVAGQDFSAELASQVLGARPLDLADAWNELEGVQVFRDGSFVHDLVREAALASVPSAIARRLHAEIAACLESGGAEPARVAEHWRAAANPAKAGPALMRAAARARDAARPHEAAALFEQAADCFAASGEPDARFEALLERVEALACDELGDETLAAARAAEEGARTDEQRLRALLAKATVEDYRYDAELSLATAREGLALARTHGRADLALRFATVMANSLDELRRVDEALALLEPLEPEAGVLPPRERAHFYLGLGIARDLDNRLADALRAFESARECASAAGDRNTLATVLSNLATTSSKRGRIARAVELGRQALQLWHEHEQPRGTAAQTETLVAHRLRDAGRYDEAIPLLEAALATFRESGSKPWVGSAAHRLALAWSQLGQHARAKKLMDEDIEGVSAKAQAMWLAHRAEVARAAGTVAVEPVRAAMAMLAGEADDGNNRLVALFASAIVPADEGEALATSCALWATARERFGMAIAAHTRAAGCALAQGAPGRARPHVAAALDLFREYEPDNFYRGEVWWTASRVLAATGDVAASDRLIAEGRAWIEAVASARVRPEFRDSFVHRNPVNRALLSAAHRLADNA